MLEALQYEFMQNALIAGLLAAVACGIIGCYVIVKRMVFISGGVSHASFGGIGLGYFLGISPIVGAFFFTIAAALVMGVVTRRAKITEDTGIGILWAMGMAMGIIFIGLTPGFAPDLMSYLFGDILIVSPSDIIMMMILAAVIVFVVALLYKEFLALSFDEEFATVAGVPVERLYFLLLCLIAFTVVVLIRVVGSILVIALLTIPAATARRFTHDLKKMMLLAILFGGLFTSGGLWLSFELDLASGATIILVSGVTFLASLFISRLRLMIGWG
ncbi:MAG: metal ABC transporter permease [Dehalococcoidia bacterium]|nr:High-affinity zinc uptake system membrane protein ZnuB [Chloroflexota bacterium]MBT9161204.1 High-affinity zinc uptake system membrane protein ZnuB [Chloroflexota bacterium]MBT9162898.1 High-affinity zinc uptake system membrane protein ZnuB [Chloroflexota bacterium]